MPRGVVSEIFERKGNPFRLAGLYGEDNQTFASLFSDETDKSIFSIPKENVQKSLEVQSDGTAVPLLEKERTAYLPYFPSAELSESKVLRDSS